MASEVKFKSLRPASSPRAPASQPDASGAARIPGHPTDDIYSPNVSEYRRVLDGALDFVTGPYSQRARRAEREGRPAGSRPRHGEVMEELRRGKRLQALAARLQERLAEVAATHGPAMPRPAPGLAHLAPIHANWIAHLEPGEQVLLRNPSTGSPASHVLELQQNVEHAVSFALHASMAADGTIDRTALSDRLGPVGLELLEAAEAAWAARSPAAQHWMSGHRSPYEPDDRPITHSELEELERKDPERFRALMEAAPIPRALPVLDEVTRFADQPLDRFNVVMIQHALGSLVPFTRALIAPGARPEDVRLVPIPYSTSPIVRRAVEDLGVKIDDHAQRLGVSPKDVERTMEQDVFHALRAAMKRSRENGKELLVVDDGGMVVRLLTGRAKYLDEGAIGLSEYRQFLLENRNVPVRVVEQTTRGITEALKAGRLPPNVTLVDMARSRAKDQEGPFIGKVVFRSLAKGMDDLGKGPLSGKTVAVLGYGVIGAAVAQSLREAGNRVVVYDPSPEARERAAAAGLEIADELPAALRDKDLVVGCSGHTSVTHQDFFSMRSGTVLASTSSKSMEFFTEHLSGRMSANLYPTYESGQHGEAPVTTYGTSFSHHRTHQVVEWDPKNRFNQVVYYLMNNGCPVNFDGEVNCVDPEDIQLTEAIKFEAVQQAAKSPVGLGLVALDEDRQDRILAAMDRHRPGWRKKG